MAARRANLTGQRFGLLTALQAEGRDATNKVLWRCRCDCGNERIVTTSALNNGHALHCGCATGANVSSGKKTRLQYKTEWMAKKRAAQKQAARAAVIKRPSNGPVDAFLYGHPAP